MRKNMAEKLNVHHVMLAALVALSGSLAWFLTFGAAGAFSASSFFSQAGAGVFYAIVWPVAAFSVFLAILAVASMSAAPSALLVAAIAASSASALVLKPGSIVAAAGFFVSMLLYSNSVRAESAERIRAAPSKCAAAGYGGSIFIFVIALSLAVYFGAQGSKEFPIPDAAIEIAIGPLLSTVGCDRQATMDACANTLADRQLSALKEQLQAKCGGDSACVALMERQLASGKAELVGEAKAGLARQLGVDADSAETLTSILTGAVKGRLNKMLEPYMGLIAPLLAIAAFTTLTTISALMRPLVLLLSAVLFTAFKTAGLVGVSRESREVEVVE